MPGLVANLNSMRLNNKWCDVIIRVDEREFHAHKVVIAANIKYFDIMLSNDSYQETKEGVITMQCVKGSELEAFLSYAYTGELLLTDDNALDLLEVANYLGEDGIREACIEFLKKNLKKELACRAYSFANSIDCLELKRAAKTTILANFTHCSQTGDYLDFDHEYLTDIFADGREGPAESQKKYFEGIARWIMHDVKQRRIRTNDLLSAIDITKLTADYLMDYLCAIVVERNDESDIIKDMMFCYHRSRQTRHVDAGQTLLAMGSINSSELMSFQSYNLAKNKWSLSEENFVYSFLPSVAVLNDKLYYSSGDSPGNNSLNVFDPATKQRTKLHVSGSILRYSAMCACSKYLYLCGGTNIGGNLCSNQVLRYDPLTNIIDTLAPLSTEKSGATAIFYQGCLHVLGGLRLDYTTFNTVEKYDSNANKWTALAPMREERYGHALAVLDGKLYACGGYDKNTVEVYDSSNNSWQLVASMDKQRTKFILVPHAGKLLAIGGYYGECTAEVYDPRKNEWQMDRQLMAGMQIQYPLGGLMSSSYIADD